MDNDNRQDGYKPQGIGNDSFFGASSSGVDDTVIIPSFGSTSQSGGGSSDTYGGQYEEEPAQGLSVITEETIVDGNITTRGHIDIVGRINGNVAAKGEVAVRGTIKGQVEGLKIGLYNCRVKGNIQAGLGIATDDNSVIEGNLQAQNIMLDGKVKGNLDANNVVVLRDNAFCLGNVTTRSLAVEPGAVLNGYVKTLVGADAESQFGTIA